MIINNSLSHRKQEPESGILYIVGTPIGNLSDLSPRAINILKNVFQIACEDTRITKKILNKFEIKSRQTSFNKNNYKEKIPQIICKLKEGKTIALVSDAGMPSICDPGEELIKESRNNGLEIICIPGPCAAITALVSSGLPSSKFIFEGFLPKKRIDRDEALEGISKNEKTTIIFESPHRLKKLLMELKNFCGGDREIHISRELTKKYEEHVKSDINTVINHFKDKEVIGEFTIVIKGLEKNRTKKIDNSNLRKELHELVKAGLSLSKASKYLAKKNNLIKGDVYNLY